MRTLLFLAALATAAAGIAAPGIAHAGGAIFDVAPTTLELKAGEAGLLYVANRGDKPVTIQIEALDWKQVDGADQLSSSQTLFTSPPLAHIAPGARQSIRVLARPGSEAGEHTYRLRVSELPSGKQSGNGVEVLMQFLVPVFVNHQELAPQLAWAAREEDGKRLLTARNLGGQAVKLDDVTFNGAAMPSGLVYILPGASHVFPVASGPTHISGHDARSGRPVSADLP